MMRSNRTLRLLLLAALVVGVAPAHAPSILAAQRVAGTIEFVARATPTGARPEPVRQFTFYLLSKSYAAIRAEAEQARPKPNQEAFIVHLGISDELKAWMRKNHTVNLTSPEIVKLLTADTILSIPEFRDAYFRANTGLGRNLPKPRYKQAGHTGKPEKYAKQKTEYETALHKFIDENPLTVEGTETELASVSPHLTWARLENAYREQMARHVPELAQTKYLVAEADTDLEGRAVLRGIAPGRYWLSTLGHEAASGDARLNWDVEVAVRPGEIVRMELTNLNAAESGSSASR